MATCLKHMQNYDERQGGFCQQCREEQQKQPPKTVWQEHESFPKRFINHDDANIV